MGAKVHKFLWFSVEKVEIFSLKPVLIYLESSLFKRGCAVNLINAKHAIFILEVFDRKLLRVFLFCGGVLKNRLCETYLSTRPINDLHRTKHFQVQAYRQVVAETTVVLHAVISAERFVSTLFVVFFQ